MLLLFYENAIISDEKLVDYCLNLSHERGKHKAKVFQSTFGITNKNAGLLKNTILTEICKQEITKIQENNSGKIYTILLKLTIFECTAEVITAWIIEHNSNKPRLITW